MVLDVTFSMSVRERGPVLNSTTWHDRKLPPQTAILAIEPVLTDATVPHFFQGRFAS